MTDDPLSDLLLRVAAQDRAAFASLYSAASAKLMGVLLRILGERAEAEDALQEVFTRVWLRANRYDPEKGRAMTWLIALARNHAIDRLRARPHAETRLIAAGEARRMSDCFATLEPDRAQAVRGAYLAGLSYTELALRHDVPLNTMRTWLRRSLLKLRECLDA
jgi:RNA polymerase sigma-70 factor (ECF subfamily)